MFALKHFAHGSYVCGLCLAVLSSQKCFYTISLTLLMPLFFILNALFLSTGLFSLKKIFFVSSGIINWYHIYQ
jgi:hypothetical protein